MRGIKEFALDLCFIGRDSDDNEHDILYGEMKQTLEESGLQGNSIIYIPVQAIEYWLWYIKVKKENTNLKNTPIIDRIRSRIELKQLVYNSTRKRISNKKSRPIVEQLCKEIDFDWLNIHSASFKHFYERFKDYLENNYGKDSKEEE